MDDHVLVNTGFDDPFINIEFVNDSLLFVNLFHNGSMVHYHFLYDIENKGVKDNIIMKEELKNCSKKNFPQKCFYNDDREEFYAFY